MSYFPNSPDQVNAANSSTAILLANATFTGTAVDCTASAISSVTVFAFSDQASAVNGMMLQWSQDGSVWTDHVQDTSVSINTSAIISDKVRARYFRVVYVNGAVTQGLFHLQTLTSSTNTSGTVRDLDSAIEGDDEAQLVRSILSGQSAVGGGAFTAVLTDGLGNLRTTAGGAGSDAFGRARVSSPETLFNVSFEYDTQPLLMQAVINGSATAAKTANVSSVTLSTVDGTTAHGVSFQSHGYYRYEPGKSQFIIMTGVIGAAKANVRSQIGYFDANNGVFFDQNNGMGITQRSNTSGSPVDTFVAQASWNIDKCNGTGPSGFNADFTKTQIFFIDMQWLGVGRVRFGFFDKGVPVIAHEIYNDNSITVPYMNTANLPIQWSIHNTGAASGATTMSANCASILSEGGAEYPQAYQFAASNGVATISGIGGTRTPLMSIRPKTTFNSITNRSKINLQDFDVYDNSSPACFWELIYNGTLTGSPVFNSVDANSGVNFDLAATGCTGGTVIASGYCPGSGKTTATVFANMKLPITLDAAGTTPDTLTVCVASVGTNIVAAAAMRWLEVR